MARVELETIPELDRSTRVPRTFPMRLTVDERAKLCGIVAGLKAEGAHLGKFKVRKPADALRYLIAIAVAKREADPPVPVAEVSDPGPADPPAPVAEVSDPVPADPPAPVAEVRGAVPAATNSVDVPTGDAS